MYPLFEIHRLLAFPSSLPDGTNIKINSSAFTQQGDYSVLALVCNNGYVVLFVCHASSSQPLVRQLPWSNHPDGDVRTVCFDPSGSWLLLATVNAVLHVLPLLRLLDSTVRVNQNWRTDDTAGIKLSGKRAVPTSLCWWQTIQGQPMAILGNEHGEISFINLKIKKEVGGTNISAGIKNLCILNDGSFSRMTTYLLITDVNDQNWNLILEEKSSDYCWLNEEKSNFCRMNTSEKSPGGASSGNLSDWKLWSSEKESNPSGSGSKHSFYPKQIARFQNTVHLSSHIAQDCHYVGAYDTSSSQFELHDCDLSRGPHSVYALPPGSQNIVLTNHLIVSSSSCKNKTLINLLSRNMADLSSSSKKKDSLDPVIQQFILKEAVIALYKCTALSSSKDSDGASKKSLRAVFLSSSANTSSPQKQRLSSGVTGSSSSSESSTPVKVRDPNQRAKSLENIALPTETILDGCIIISNHGVYKCKPRFSVERLFLKYTSSPTDLPQAERFGALLGLDIYKLYEIAADVQLSCGQFPQAVRLYQLSKCPQLKRVAHFVSYGYLSELLAYMQVLFTTKAMEISPQDKVHFANIAAHCFVQQILEKQNEKSTVVQAFRDFLRDNMYYDDSVVIRLLCEQKLYDLLYLCALLRGQHLLMVDQLLQEDSQHSLGEATCSALASRGYSSLLVKSGSENYLSCVTDPDLLIYLAQEPQLLRSHLHLMANLLPQVNETFMLRIAKLYDASRPTVNIAVKRILATSKQRRYLGSVSSMSTDSLELTQSEEETVNEEDIIKFFLFVVLMLNHQRASLKYDPELLRCDFWEEKDADCNHHYIPKHITSSERTLACGQCHGALVAKGKVYTWGKAQFGRLGHSQDSHREICPPTCVEMLDVLRVKVLQLACGAHHTLALTDNGVFAWGSSRYGQLGLGNLQRSWNPRMVEGLHKDDVSKISCGLYHSLAVTRKGRVFTWGWGVHGQLGHGSCNDERVPRQVAALEKVIVITVQGGSGHSAVLTDKGDVYTFGCNTFGQLGLGNTVKHSTPQKVSLEEPVRLLAVGFFHVIVVTNSNTIITWGSNPQTLRLRAQSSRRTRLQAVVSQNEMITSQRNPHSSLQGNTLVQTLVQGHQGHLHSSVVETPDIRSKIVQIACGSNHSVAITEDGEIFTWGRNTEGQLGHGTRKDQKTPQMVLLLNDRKITQVACGQDFTLALDSHNKVWGWGQNDSGQLGLKIPHEDHPKPSRSLTSRIITIRTNKRLITIPQGHRSGELKPLEVTTFPSEVMQSSLPAFDSCSYDGDMPLRQMIYYNAYAERSLLLPELETLDNPPYSSRALHVALKAFHHSYDSTSVINHCVSFGDFQSASKICLLEGQFAKAVQYQLQAQSAAAKVGSEDLLKQALEAVDYYTGLIDKENCEINKLFLENIIKFWMEWELPIQPLESLFHTHLSQIGYPLGLVLFCRSQIKDPFHSSMDKFVRNLSTNFCITISSMMMEHIVQGRRHTELIEAMLEITNTEQLLHQIHLVDETAGWEASIPPQRLWSEILRNFQKGVAGRMSINLSSSDVDQLTKSLLTDQGNVRNNQKPREEKLQTTTQNHDVVLFTCGHHFTSQAFHSSILPDFIESMHRMPQPLPLTTKLLLRGYQLEGVIPFACPNCVVAEVRNNW